MTTTKKPPAKKPAASPQADAPSLEEQEEVAGSLQATRLLEGGPMIFPAMAAVLREVGAIPKGQRNKQQGYEFRGIDDVMKALHPLFAKHGIFVAPGVVEKEYGESQSKQGTKMTDAYLTLSYRFYAEDGSYVDASVPGESRDAADKATNQASSSAFKYLLLQMFVIPVEGQTEADHESPEAVVPQAGPPPIHPNVRARTAVLEAAGGDKERAGEVWAVLCERLQIDPEASIEDETTADVIVHQMKGAMAKLAERDGG